MSASDFTVFLRQEARKCRVSNAELAALELALDNHSSEQIAQKLGISPAAARQRLSEVYRKFQVEGRGPVKLRNLMQRLNTQYKELSSTTAIAPAPSPPELLDGGGRSWDELIPIVNHFYGRQPELTMLHHAIIEDHTPVVGLVGLPGIGKTTLAAKLVEDLESSFDRVIWRTLNQPIPLISFLNNLLQSLQEPSDLQVPSVQAGLEQLLTYLEQQATLLVLDNFDAVLRPGDPHGRYQSGCEGYGQLIQAIAKGDHPSCLILTSHVETVELVQLARQQLAVTLKLAGLSPEAAQSMLNERGLKGDAKFYQQLIERYRSNPSQLEDVATIIQNVFDGDVAQFIGLDTTIVDPTYRKVLDQYFNYLTELEVLVVHTLAQAEQPIGIQTIKENARRDLATSEVIEALEQLSNRSLLEKKRGRGQSELLFTLQPVIRKYVRKYRMSPASA
ncbi:NB-ARC domain-containing protein [Trichothermofontia sp.]